MGVRSNFRLRSKVQLHTRQTTRPGRPKSHGKILQQNSRLQTLHAAATGSNWVGPTIGCYLLSHTTQAFDLPTLENQWEKVSSNQKWTLNGGFVADVTSKAVTIKYIVIILTFDSRASQDISSYRVPLLGGGFGGSGIRAGSLPPGVMGSEVGPDGA